jgi:serine phosphatase RsbU (regulator of sigma subunit)
MDISLCAIDIDERKIKWAGANNPLWYINNKIFKEIKAHKQPIGKTDNPTPFVTHEFNLTKGDTLFLITDGYADQFGKPLIVDGTSISEKKFKYRRLKDLLLLINDKPLPEQFNILDKTFEDWKGSFEQVDDVSMIAIAL